MAIDSFNREHDEHDYNPMDVGVDYFQTNPYLVYLQIWSLSSVRILSMSTKQAGHVICFGVEHGQK